ncbi:MAG: tetratricopeptide repeat protein [Sandaracinaceae bacterium]|nr:tetratricopeptide repeat protein [Sandaracinaceae bacterium]
MVEAREHLNRGTQLLQQENYDAALAEFQRAYDLVGDHPARHLILYNIALAHERMFRYDLALEYYNRFLAEAPADAPQRAEVQGPSARSRTSSPRCRSRATCRPRCGWPTARWARRRGRCASPPGATPSSCAQRADTDGRREIQIAARETQSLSFTLSELASQYRGSAPSSSGARPAWPSRRRSPAEAWASRPCSGAAR